jgi:hypothetical protein
VGYSKIHYLKINRVIELQMVDKSKYIISYKDFIKEKIKNAAANGLWYNEGFFFNKKIGVSTYLKQVEKKFQDNLFELRKLVFLDICEGTRRRIKESGDPHKVNYIAVAEFAKRYPSSVISVAQKKAEALGDEIISICLQVFEKLKQENENSPDVAYLQGKHPYDAFMSVIRNSYMFVPSYKNSLPLHKAIELEIELAKPKPRPGEVNNNNGQ